MHYIYFMLKQMIWLYKVIPQINPPQSETNNTSIVVLCEATIHLTTTVYVWVCLAFKSIFLRVYIAIFKS